MKKKRILSMIMSAAMVLTVSMSAAAEEKEPEVRITQTDIDAEGGVLNFRYKYNGENYLETANTSEDGNTIYSIYNRDLEKTFENSNPVYVHTDDVFEAVNLKTEDGFIYADANIKRTYIDPYGNNIPELSQWCGHSPHGDYTIVTKKEGTYSDNWYIIDKKGNIKIELPSEFKKSTNGIGNGLFEDFDNQPYPTGIRRIFDINGKNVYVSPSRHYSFTDEEIAETNGKYDWSEDYYISFVGYYSDGLMPVNLCKDSVESTDIFGYMDSDLNLAINLTEKYGIKICTDEAAGFYDGYAPLNFSTDDQSNKYGYIDKQGDTVIPGEYDDALGYGNGLFSVGKDGKYGFVDKNNKAVIPLEYDNVSQFVDGVAYGVKDGKLVIFEVSVDLSGDATGDGKLNVRDAAFIAKMLAQGKVSDLPENSDFNGDGKINVRDAAAIAKFLATGKK